MGRFSEKQLLLVTIAGSLVFVLGFGGLIWWDLDRIYAAELSDENPAAAEIADSELWGQRRWIQEIDKQIDAARAEAELIPSREQEVIVYREIVARDTAILPNEDEVNRLTTTVGDFERMSGVTLDRIGEMNTAAAAGQAIARIPIKLQLSGSFDEVLKYINLFETLDRLVNVTGFTLNAGTPDSESHAVHSVSLDLVTFMYTSNAGLAKPVEISNYERRKSDPVIQKAIRQQKAAYVEKYQLKSRMNRRDPLMDPRKSADEVSEEISDADLLKKTKLVNGLKFEVEMLKEDVRQESYYRQNHKLVPLIQLKKQIDDKVARLQGDIAAAESEVTVPELQQIFHDDVVAPFEQMRAGRDVGDQPVIVTRSQVEQYHNTMLTLFTEGKFDECVRRHEEFLSFAHGQDVAEDAQQTMLEMQDLREQAAVNVAFDRLDLRYRGLILGEKNSILFVESSDQAVKGCRVGDTVDFAKKCTIVEISAEHVTYDFDGFVIKDEIHPPPPRTGDGGSKPQ